MSFWEGENSINTLGQALNYAGLRQRLLADNIANAQTPGYKRKDATFANHYRTALRARVTHPRHIAIYTEPTIVRDSILQTVLAKMMITMWTSIWKWRNWPGTHFISAALAGKYPNPWLI